MGFGFFMNAAICIYLLKTMVWDPFISGNRIDQYRDAVQQSLACGCMIAEAIITRLSKWCYKSTSTGARTTIDDSTITFELENGGRARSTVYGPMHLKFRNNAACLNTPEVVLTPKKRSDDWGNGKHTDASTTLDKHIHGNKIVNAIEDMPSFTTARGLQETFETFVAQGYTKLHQKDQFTCSFGPYDLMWNAESDTEFYRRWVAHFCLIPCAFYLLLVFGKEAAQQGFEYLEASNTRRQAGHDLQMAEFVLKGFARLAPGVLILKNTVLKRLLPRFRLPAFSARSVAVCNIVNALFSQSVIDKLCAWVSNDVWKDKYLSLYGAHDYKEFHSEELVEFLVPSIFFCLMLAILADSPVRKKDGERVNFYRDDNHKIKNCHLVPILGPTGQLQLTGWAQSGLYLGKIVTLVMTIYLCFGCSHDTKKVLDHINVVANALTRAVLEFLKANSVTQESTTCVPQVVKEVEYIPVQLNATTFDSIQQGVKSVETVGKVGWWLITGASAAYTFYIKRQRPV